MKRESSGPVLTTVFVDYDNVYLSLKRKNEDAAKRFAKDSSIWLQGIASGELITPKTSLGVPSERRIVMSRCYGNSQPRRNAHDNSTDMCSFPFIRHHFQRSGFEVIDCPPLTQQLKNSADIRIVMDVSDILNHPTFFDEFIILSGDADFTPVLHRLRAHARRTVVYANDHTALPYTAISDGEVKESDLLALLTSGRTIAGESTREITAAVPVIDVEAARKSILSEVVDFVRSAPQAVPLETLADRAVRVVGRDKTVGTNWGGYGSFRDLLLQDLPDDIHLSDTPPYTVFDANRHISAAGLIAPQLAAPTPELRSRDLSAEISAAEAKAIARPSMPPPQKALQQSAPLHQPAPNAFQPAPQQRYAPPATPAPVPPAPPLPSARGPEISTAATPQMPRQALGQQRPSMPPPSGQPSGYQPDHAREAQRPPMSQTPPPPMSGAPRSGEQATQIQQSIARIHEACQAPALAPAEYRVLFDVMAQEITANGLQGAQTLVNITQRAREFGLDIKRDDLRFIYDVVSESDPWFEQGTSATLFASRFRNFVVARCRSQGLSLSADELDLVEAWFSAPQPPAPSSRALPYGGRAPGAPAAPASKPVAAASHSGEQWWSLEEGRQRIVEQREAEQKDLNPYAQNQNEEEFPRIVRSRFRG